MKELYVFCEGPTEQGFCRQCLAPFLFPEHDGRVHPLKIAHSKHHGRIHRGGAGKYAALRRDLHNQLKSRPERHVRFTSMIDLYGLPRDFPGKTEITRDPANPFPYVNALTAAFAANVGDERFIPYLQLHEYETILFSDPAAFGIAFDPCAKEIEALIAIAAAFPTIEHINDGRETSPSKRIIDLIPAYEGRKSIAGPDIAEYIGIPAIRSRCPHFDAWLTSLVDALRD